MSKLSKTFLPKYRSIDSSWDGDEVVILPLASGGIPRRASVVYHTTSFGKIKYLVYYGMKFQIYRHFANGLVWIEKTYIDNWEDNAKQLVLVKDGYSVFTLRHNSGILHEVCFHHQGNKLSGILNKSTTQGIGVEYAVVYGPYLSFCVNELGSKNHEMTRMIVYKEKSFSYYNKCFNIYQRYLEARLNEIH